MSEANKITSDLLDGIPKEFPNIRVWRSNRVKAMAIGRGGKPRMIDAGINGQGDISGIVAPSGRRCEIEVKAGKDKLNPDQISFRAMILGRGGICIEARSFENGMAALRAALKPEEIGC